MQTTTHVLAVFATISLAAAIAAQDPQPLQKKVRLWDPESPCCILYAEGQDPRLARLPEPYTPRRIDEDFGPGVTETDLFLGTAPWSNRPPSVLKGSGGAGLVIFYSDAAGTGFWDPTLGPARRSAFQYAAGLVVGMINDANLVVSVDASFPSLGTTGMPLASGGPTQYWLLLLASTYFGEPLFSHLLDFDPDTSQYDITIQFNGSWDSSSTPFYYGQDSATGAAQFNFVTVAVHEMIHGLDFAHGFTASGAPLAPDPFMFDRFLVDASGTKLYDLPAVPSTVEGNDVFWDGNEARITWFKHAGGSGSLPMFAPTPFVVGSSLGHFDEAVFTGAFDLMSPTATLGSLLLKPDPIVRGLLQDIGWDLEFEANYVDLNTAISPQTGEPAAPFATLTQGLASLLSDGKRSLYVANGTYSTGGPFLIDQDVTLRGWPGSWVLR